MCLFCHSEDDYESNHSHKCDDHCRLNCKWCGEGFCVYSNDYNKYKNEIVCLPCFNQETSKWDDMGTYYQEVKQ